MRRPASLEALDAVPFEAAGTVADLAAESDVVALCLRRDSDNLQVAVEAAFARAAPIFGTFSERVIHMGPAGAGQFGKLFNNTLMMLNQQNIIEVLETAAELRLPLGPLLEVLRSGSATSFALRSFGPSVTSANAAHLKELQLIDMDLFRTAVDGLGDQALVDRAVAAAEHLPDVTAVIEANTAAATG